MKSMTKRALALFLCLFLCLALLPSQVFAEGAELIDLVDLSEDDAAWLIPPEDGGEIVLIDPEPEALEAISVGTPLTGDLADGWQKIDGSWYYFRSGTAVTGWQKIGNYWYYFNGSGVMQTGWQKLGSTWYYFGSGGNMITGWQKVGGSWYYFAEGGNMVTGWQKVGGSWYYFSSGGSMVTGWQKLGGSWYYFAEGGAMQTGWLKLGGVWYYFAEGGAMQTGWQKLGSSWYYFAEGGAMQTGWQKIGGSWYYFAEGGAMQTGWLKLNDKWYYLETNGKMLARTTAVINGTAYSFDSQGVYLSAAEVRQRILAQQANYPEGMHWTNDDSYEWPCTVFPNTYYTGFGCVAIAMILSDAAFGDLEGRFVDEVDYASLRAGDILRINNDRHSVIITEIHDSYVVIAEGNYNSSIHWGRTLSRQTVEAADYYITRYPV